MVAKFRISGAVLFSTTEENIDRWVAELRTRKPDLDLRIWPEVGNVSDIRYAIVARPPKGDLKRYPNLKAILSMWAGVEDLIADESVPPVPIVRMVEPGLTNGIVTYVVHHVIGFHIHALSIQKGVWEHPFHQYMQVASDTRVGILGLGHLGQACAAALLPFGFQVAGYSNSRKQIEGIESFAGDGELEAFLRRTDVLVCLLPRTAKTDNILNRDTLAMLPKGAGIVNCGRGESIDDDALLESVRNGHISRAVLDVFRVEPLPLDHPYWHEPNIVITPHCASKPDPRTGSATILANIEKLEAGGTVDHTVRKEIGY